MMDRFVVGDMVIHTIFEKAGIGTVKKIDRELTEEL